MVTFPFLLKFFKDTLTSDPQSSKSLISVSSRAIKMQFANTTEVSGIGKDYLGLPWWRSLNAIASCFRYFLLP